MECDHQELLPSAGGCWGWSKCPPLRLGHSSRFTQTMKPGFARDPVCSSCAEPTPAGQGNCFCMPKLVLNFLTLKKLLKKKPFINQLTFQALKSRYITRYSYIIRQPCCLRAITPMPAISTCQRKTKHRQALPCSCQGSGLRNIVFLGSVASLQSQQKQADLEFEASLLYRVSSRTKKKKATQKTLSQKVSNNKKLKSRAIQLSTHLRGLLHRFPGYSNIAAACLPHS